MHSEQPDDRNVEEQLRAVPAPPQFVQRLCAALLPSDEQIDARLREVAVPPLLLVRLQNIIDDVSLEDELVNLSLPAGFINRMQHLPFELQPVAQTSNWRRQVATLSASAALVWLLISLGGVSFGWWFADTANIAFRKPNESILLVNRPLELAATNSSSTDNTNFSLAENLALKVSDSSSGFQEGGSLTVEPPDVVDASPATGPVSEWFTSIRGGMQPWASVVQLRWGILGAPYDDRDYVLLEQPFARSTPGIEPPLVKGYNRAFWLKHHVFPPISPGVAGLERLPLPLEANVANFDRIEQMAHAGRKPDNREVQVEDFVAHALGIVPAARTGAIELDVAAAPSPFGPRATHLLQCVVKAGASASSQRTHLVVAVDLSSSMRQHWAEIQRTLMLLPERLGPEDRLSLVAFGEEVELLLESLSASDWPLWREQVQKLQPSGTANLAEGLRAALTTSLDRSEETSDFRREMLFLSDHEGTWNRQSLNDLSGLIESGQAGGVEVSLVDLASSPSANEAHTCLAILARAAGVKCYCSVFVGARGERQSPLQSWQQVRFQPIGSEVELSITFNPKSVAAYRLVGQDGGSWTEITHAAAPIELRPGDSCSSLVELAFQPRANDDIGRVELRWRNPMDGEYVVQQMRLSRSQFAPSWTATPLWFQRSCVAAEVAEVLRGSREALREADWNATERHDLARVLSVLRQSSTELKNDPHHARLVQSIEAWRRMGIK